MSGSQPQNLCGEPIVLGIELFSPISAVAGSPSIFFTQPILTGKVFASSAVIIGAELILFIAHHFFNVKSIPILDPQNQQTVQIPITELQEFLRWMVNGAGTASNSNTAADGNNRLINLADGGVVNEIGERGFVTPETPEAPVIFAIYAVANYSNKPFTPYIIITVPLLTFPGLRGALPLLIIALLGTILVRAVVPPETTGSKPMTKPRQANKLNPLTFTSDDLLKMLTKFGEQFRPK